jgi:hypothetical protein
MQGSKKAPDPGSFATLSFSLRVLQCTGKRNLYFDQVLKSLLTSVSDPIRTRYVFGPTGPVFICRIQIQLRILIVPSTNEEQDPDLQDPGSVIQWHGSGTLLLSMFSILLMKLPNAASTQNGIPITELSERKINVTENKRINH